MFTFKLYYNTGFDAVNAPLNETVLNSAASRTSDFDNATLDIHQIDFLSSVRIHVPNGEDDLIGADYLKLSQTIPAKSNVFSAHTKSAFYSISSYSMPSMDVAELYIIFDPIMTLGGFDKLKFTSGVTERISIKDDNDSDFGKYVDEDPMLIPDHPIHIEHAGHSIWDCYYNETDRNECAQKLACCNGYSGMFFNYDASKKTTDPTTAKPNEQVHVIVSTVDLAGLGFDPNTGEMTGIQPIYYIDPNDGESKVSFPKIVAADNSRFALFKGDIAVDSMSVASVGGSSYDQGNSFTYSYNALLGSVKDTVNSSYMPKGYPAYSLFITKGINTFTTRMLTEDQAEKALAALRAIGMENAILASYTVPAALISEDIVQWSSEAVPGRLMSGVVNVVSTNGWASQGSGNTPANTPTLVQTYMPGANCYDYLYKKTLGDGSVGSFQMHHYRALYGKHNKYILAAAATGSKIEAKPEELIFMPSNVHEGSWSGTPTNGLAPDMAPYICVVSDPRPTGRPYFNFVNRRQHAKGYGGLLDQRKALCNVLQGAIAGEMWRSEPIQFTEFSGFLQANVGYQINKAQKDMLASADYNLGRNLASIEDARMRNQNEINKAAEKGLLTGGLKSIVNPLGGLKEVGGSALKAAEDSFWNNEYAAMDAANERSMAASKSGMYGWSEAERRRQAAFEESQFNLATAYAEPDVKFLPSETTRDTTGNGVYYARYVMEDDDYVKFDRILDRFGIRISLLLGDSASTINNDNGIPVREADFNDTTLIPNKKFFYMKASGVTVEVKAGSPYITWQGNQKTYRLNKRMLMEVASVFENGYRVWNRRPMVGAGKWGGWNYEAN